MTEEEKKLLVDIKQALTLAHAEEDRQIKKSSDGLGHFSVSCNVAALVTLLSHIKYDFLNITIDKLAEDIEQEKRK